MPQVNGCVTSLIRRKNFEIKIDALAYSCKLLNAVARSAGYVNVKFNSYFLSARFKAILGAPASPLPAPLSILVICTNARSLIW
jgi:hypothetical protein